MSASGRTGWPRESRSIGNVVESDQVCPGVLGVHDDRCDPREGVGGTTVPFHRDTPPPLLLISTVLVVPLSTVTVRTEPDWTPIPLVRRTSTTRSFSGRAPSARESGVSRNVRTDRESRRTRPGTGQVERDLVAPGSFGLDDARVDAGERVDGTTIPLGLDTPLAVIGYLHGVGRRLADADAQDRSTLLGDASCPGEMHEGRENERGAIREAHLTGQQQAALQRLHLREELPRRARALKRWLVAHGDAPREKDPGQPPRLDVHAKDGQGTPPHIRTSTWREFNWKASSDSQIPWRRAPATPGILRWPTESLASISQ